MKTPTPTKKQGRLTPKPAAPADDADADKIHMLVTKHVFLMTSRRALPPQCRKIVTAMAAASDGQLVILNPEP